MHRHVPPSLGLVEAGVPSATLRAGSSLLPGYVVPMINGTYDPLRLLTRHPPGLRIHLLIPRVTKDVGLRPRETSLVALPAFPTFRSPYAEEFLEAAPESSPFPWLSPALTGSALLCPLRANMTALQSLLRGPLAITTTGLAPASCQCLSGHTSARSGAGPSSTRPGRWLAETTEVGWASGPLSPP